MHKNVLRSINLHNVQVGDRLSYSGSHEGVLQTNRKKKKTVEHYQRLICPKILNNALTILLPAFMVMRWMTITCVYYPKRWNDLRLLDSTDLDMCLCRLKELNISSAVLSIGHLCSKHIFSSNSSEKLLLLMKPTRNLPLLAPLTVILFKFTW